MRRIGSLVCVGLMIAGCAAIRTRSVDPADRDEAYAVARRGLQQLRIQNPRRAIEDFDRALRVDPDMTFAYLGRGLARARQHRWVKALADHTRAIELDPASAVPRYLRGWVYSQTGDHERAIADFGEAIARDRIFWQAYALRGHEYRALRDDNRARADFQLALDLHRKLVTPEAPKRRRLQPPPVEFPEVILDTLYRPDGAAAP